MKHEERVAPKQHGEGTVTEDKVTEEALAWLIRINEGDFRDWEAFEDWIDRDPAHSIRYRQLAMADAEVAAELRSRPVRSIPPRAHPIRRRVAIGAGLAAVAASLLLLIPHHERSFTIETALGVTRSIVLANGDRIDLNGGARIVVDPALGRHVRLDQGEALFTIKHDAAHPFTVDIGETSVRDVGTVFNIARRDDGAIGVAVSEGSVLFDPEGAARPLSRGEALRMGAHDNIIVVAQVDPDAVGAWRTGRLKYSGAPLSDVAADLSRSVGYRVAVAPTIAKRPFTGTLVIGDRQTLITRTAALLGLEAQKKGSGWLLAESPQRTR